MFRFSDGESCYLEEVVIKIVCVEIMNQHHTHTEFVVDCGGIPGTQTVPFQ